MCQETVQKEKHDTTYEQHVPRIAESFTQDPPKKQDYKQEPLQKLNPSGSWARQAAMVKISMLLPVVGDRLMWLTYDKSLNLR
jgi:hypothetical protein